MYQRLPSGVERALIGDQEPPRIFRVERVMWEATKQQSLFEFSPSYSRRHFGEKHTDWPCVCNACLDSQTRKWGVGKNTNELTASSYTVLVSHVFRARCAADFSEAIKIEICISKHRSMRRTPLNAGILRPHSWVPNSRIIINHGRPSHHPLVSQL